MQRRKSESEDISSQSGTNCQLWTSSITLFESLILWLIGWEIDLWDWDSGKVNGAETGEIDVWKEVQCIECTGEKCSALSAVRSVQV